MTRSARRRSSGATPGAVVLTSLCWCSQLPGQPGTTPAPGALLRTDFASWCSSRGCIRTTHESRIRAAAAGGSGPGGFLPPASHGSVAAFSGRGWCSRWCSNSEELGPGVWCGNDSEPATRGFVALGVPIGQADFVQRTLVARLEGKRCLLRELQELLDMQSAWLLLLYCASPRAQHVFAHGAAARLGHVCG